MGSRWAGGGRVGSGHSFFFLEYKWVLVKSSLFHFFLLKYPVVFQGLKEINIPLLVGVLSKKISKGFVIFGSCGGEDPVEKYSVFHYILLNSDFFHPALPILALESLENLSVLHLARSRMQGGGESLCFTTWKTQWKRSSRRVGGERLKNLGFHKATECNRNRTK